MSHDTGISQYDRLRQEYEEGTVGDTGLYPTEIRQIIALRRRMEERIGTNGSIKLTLMLARSVHDFMAELDAFQDAQVDEEAEEDPEDDVIADE